MGVDRPGTDPRPDLRPDPGLDRAARRERQRAVARAAVFRDAHGPDPSALAGRTVVGVDQAVTEETVVSAAVALRDGTVQETAVAREPVRTPYVPGLLAYREGEAVLGALAALAADPDLVVCDGSGRIHRRQAGLATHVGVVRDIPTVGVAKGLLCGRPVASLADPLPEGRRVPIEADGDIEAVATDDPDWPVVGAAYQSRQYAESASQHVNPLYVSPGHRVGHETAVATVAATCAGYKLPEPTRAADQAATAAREDA